MEEETKKRHRATRGVTEEFENKLLTEAIFPRDIDIVKATIKPGYKVYLLDRKTSKHDEQDLEDSIVRTWVTKLYPNIVMFEGGHSCTYPEFIRYLRDKSLPVCMPLAPRVEQDAKYVANIKKALAKMREEDARRGRNFG